MPHRDRSTDKLMTLADLAEMLGIPISTLYAWRHRGEGPSGYRVGPPRPIPPRHC